ncbi:hypothetical protein MTR67_023932 [Solanum verrucosum]|uniref:Uncharacterized protein n=1 Tax=Solanum verrucosum TaxID=315347 RepID=A0AAF0TRV8_SOLVR|nr:hypothetical protein MTR67_023932 [Solanum verrucosum]
MRRAKLRSKSLHDPSRIPVPPTPPPPPEYSIEQVHPVLPVHAPPPRSLNRLKVVGLRTILEEKRQATDRVVERKLVPKRKKKERVFTPVDHVVVRAGKLNAVAPTSMWC